jgi:hypothetical protein
MSQGKVTKRYDKKKKGVKIEGMNWRAWVLYTILYVVGLALLSGELKYRFPEPFIEIGFLHIDIQYGFFLLGLAIWAVATRYIAMRYEKR